MKHAKIGLVVLFGFALLITGCGKKATTEQANVAGTGFDTVATTEELAQLPQANTAAPQAAVEALPVEAAPVTQPAAALQGAVSALGQTLSHDQQIQTALKAAGLYTGNVDGKLGPASRKAIEAFQKANGLKVDGKVGPKTWAALEKYLTGGASATDVAAPATE